MNRGAGTDTKHSTGDAPSLELEQLLPKLRPRVHRYCARMLGSVIDGEDAVQDAFTKAIEAWSGVLSLDNPEAWVFRIAHNAVLDSLRRRARRPEFAADEELSTMADPRSMLDEHFAATSSLQTFLRLPVSQRSCVILMDVLGYSLKEIESMTTLTVPAIKASLHRGRERLREFAQEPDEALATELGENERRLLAAYADRFNARDFDAVRDLLAEEVRLEVVARTTLVGKAQVAGIYFENYAQTSDWYFVPGLVESRPAVLAVDPSDPRGRPRYFILLDWKDGKVEQARDFRHAEYVVEGAAVALFCPPPESSD